MWFSARRWVVSDLSGVCIQNRNPVKCKQKTYVMDLSYWKGPVSYVLHWKSIKMEEIQLATWYLHYCFVKFYYWHSLQIKVDPFFWYFFHFKRCFNPAQVRCNHWKQLSHWIHWLSRSCVKHILHRELSSSKSLSVLLIVWVSVAVDVDGIGLFLCKRIFCVQGPVSIILSSLPFLFSFFRQYHHYEQFCVFWDYLWP